MDIHINKMVLMYNVFHQGLGTNYKQPQLNRNLVLNIKSRNNLWFENLTHWISYIN